MVEKLPILQCEPGFSAMKFIKTDMTTKLEVENVFRDALSITEPKMSYSFYMYNKMLCHSPGYSWL